ncbi:hypothetical protein R1sor_003408 [Riccia sorocarpa]|uniref:Uncharacterized protein n=1 Tax=Riccia sorocarpa TaxID=122646 RepID=A0ABD3H362_9MARC
MSKCQQNLKKRNIWSDLPVFLKQTAFLGVRSLGFPPNAKLARASAVFSASSSPSCLISLLQLLRQLKEEESIIATTEDVDFLTFRLKENLQDFNALMIFDDVSGDDRSSLVEKLVIPSAKNVKYLFTSQESRGWHGFQCVYKIDRITVAVALEIIAKRIGLPSDSIPEPDKGIILEIIKATDFHPLALASIAAAVQKNEKGRVDPSEWKEVKKNLLSYLTDERGVDVFGKSYLPGSVFAAMMLAVQGLHRENKRLFTALCILALFERPFPKKVPLFLLLSTKSRLSEHFIRVMKNLEDRGFVDSDSLHRIDRRQGGILLSI